MSHISASFLFWLAGWENIFFGTFDATQKGDDTKIMKDIKKDFLFFSRGERMGDFGFTVKELGSPFNAKPNLSFS